MQELLYMKVIFCFQTSHDQVSFRLEMRELSTSGNSRIIDTFGVMDYLSRSKSPLYLDGDFGVATVLLSYEIKCFNHSACGTTPSTSFANGTH